MEIYVKSTSNCQGMPLQTFEVLSPTWTGDRLNLPIGDPSRALWVVGWTDLFCGTACPVNVAKAKTNGAVGWLVWGGNSGVRILDKGAPIDPGTEHLPRGYGQPIIWVEDVKDFPPSVQKVVK